MAKSKSDRVETGSGPALTHNPFGTLAGLAQSLPPGVARDGTPSPITKAGKTAGARLVLRRETKHRGGRAVVVITGFESSAALDEVAVKQLAAELKSALACGGTVERAAEGLRIVLQGDEPARVAAMLTSRGHRVAGTVR